MLLFRVRFVVAIALVISLLLGAAAPVQATSVEPMSFASLPFLGKLFAGQRPDGLGVHAGKLAPCPTSPNCVVSQGTTDAEHTIAPIAYSGDPGRAMARLVAIVSSLPRTAIIEQTDRYLYAEFTSRWMGFVDDVEFCLDPAEPVIHVRSASRLGESDLGVNRKRIESLRQAFGT